MRDDPPPSKRLWHAWNKHDYDHRGAPSFVSPWVGLSKKAVLILLIGPTALAILGARSLDVFPVEPSTVLGSASVVDGDTLRIDGQRIRLYGIDAPEAQ